MTELRYDSFTVNGDPGTLDAQGAEFISAIDYGFLDRTRDEELVIRQLDRFRAEKTVLTAAYDDDQDPRSLGADRPVATFGDFRGSVCVREGVVIESQMVTEVTVRGTHRRRGILSKMMRGALARAKDEGLALSLLTASEGGIYGRFGFGAAAYSQQITVRAHHGLRLREDVREAIADITVIVPTWEAFGEAYAQFYPQFQRASVGQVGHTHAFRRRATGEHNAWAIQGVDNDFRPLLALDSDGEVVGYALSTADWASHRAEVADLGAATPIAEIALWDALAATDLVNELDWKEGALDTALTWALQDGRDVQFGARMDHLWVRILDLPAAFAARGLAADGSFTLTVTDREGYTAGTWALTSADGETSAVQVDQPSDVHLELDVETLGSLYLGAVTVQTLVAIGRARATGIDELGRLLAPGTAPRNTYTF